MTGMTSPIRKSDIARAGATPEFAELCKALYGDAVDPQAVWDDVIKASPDQADVNAGGQRLRRNVERTSNAVGIAAGSLGLAAALKDPRLARGGKVARALSRTGSKMPAVADKIAEAHPRLGGALAAGAVATQVGNLGGDALIAGTLGQKKKDPVGKRLVPTGEVSKLALPSIPRGVKDAAMGLRRAWNPKAGLSSTHSLSRPVQGPLTQTAQRAHDAGADVATALSTNTGKVVAGGAAAVGAVKAGQAQRRRSGGVDYVPDYETYGKADSEDGLDVVFKGTFTEIDQDKRTAFGWASVVKINGQPVVDRQGDYIDLDDLEKAAYEYVHKSRVGGDMHRRTQSLMGDSAHKVSDMIESIVFTPEKIAKMGLPSDFPQGWWVGYKIHDDETWDLVKKGERTGFSIHGKGLRKAADIDEIMGYGR